MTPQTLFSITPIRKLFKHFSYAVVANGMLKLDILIMKCIQLRLHLILLNANLISN